LTRGGATSRADGARHLAQGAQRDAPCQQRENEQARQDRRG
jgi:hypothetical protein